MTKQIRMKNKMFDLVPTDILYIISSFLLPRDICRFRILSKEYFKIITQYLLKTKQTVNLYELICPMCGNDWINTSKIEFGNFLDIDSYTHYFDVIERQKFILKIFGENENKRQHLLCSECENISQESCYLKNFKFNHNYKLYLDFYSSYPWACIVKIDDKGNYLWDQYNYYEDEVRIYTIQELGLEEESDYEESDYFYEESDWN